MWVVDLGHEAGTSTVTELCPKGATAGTFTVGNEPRSIAFDGLHMWVVNTGPATSVTEL
jgi:hypothetical protein